MCTTNSLIRIKNVYVLFLSLLLVSCGTFNFLKSENDSTHEELSGESEINSLERNNLLESRDMRLKIYNSQNYTTNQQQQMLAFLGKINCRIIHFDFDKDHLNQNSKKCLDKVANYLIKYNQPVRIAGHTDIRGSEKYNLNLGQRRADSVRTYLLSKQVPKKLICSVSYGKSQPIVSPSSLYGRFCSNSIITKECKSKAYQHAYYLDRRAELYFGELC